MKVLHGQYVPLLKSLVLALIQQGDERGYWKIVYPEGWDAVELSPGDQATWMKIDIEEEDPKTQKLWEKMLLKNNGESNED